MAVLPTRLVPLLIAFSNGKCWAVALALITNSPGVNIAGTVSVPWGLKLIYLPVLAVIATTPALLSISSSIGFFPTLILISSSLSLCILLNELGKSWKAFSKALVASSNDRSALTNSNLPNCSWAIAWLALVLLSACSASLRAGSRLGSTADIIPRANPGILIAPDSKAIWPLTLAAPVWNFFSDSSSEYFLPVWGLTWFCSDSLYVVLYCSIVLRSVPLSWAIWAWPASIAKRLFPPVCLKVIL